MKIDLSAIIDKSKVKEYKVKKEENKQKAKENKEYLKEKRLFEDKFYRLMFELGLYNKFNKTYYLSILEKKIFGYTAKVYLEAGLSFQDLEKHKGIIQENLRCIWIMTVTQFEEFAFIKIVTKPIDYSLEYEIPDIKPHELYMGLDFSLSLIINNNNENCMFLISGATGAGKTRYIYMILLSWILSCKVNEVEIYLSDIAKDEYIHLKDVKHVRYYASDLEQLHKMMLYIDIKLVKRKETLSRARSQGWATNIEEYNKASKSKLSYCYILIDEFSVLMPDNTDTKEEKEMKQQTLDIIKKAEKIGRSLGVFPIIATQKTVKDELPSIVKNMSAVRISFRANDHVSSEVIIGDNSAVGLMDRYAIYSLNGGDKKDYLFSPYITMDMIKTLLKPHIDKNFKKVDVEKETKVYHHSEEKQESAKSISSKSIKKKNHSYEEIDTTKTHMPIDHTKDSKIYKIGKGDGYVDY